MAMVVAEPGTKKISTAQVNFASSTESNPTQLCNDGGVESDTSGTSSPCGNSDKDYAAGSDDSDSVIKPLKHCKLSSQSAVISSCQSQSHPQPQHQVA
ncbi:hypothetical protein PABG_12114 [Paracoccidioides brasiliensis Pb03]|nr:hypothetical protein PABG_12114 [Paracoccidioides brasiliensis Pb03]